MKEVFGIRVKLMRGPHQGRTGIAMVNKLPVDGLVMVRWDNQPQLTSEMMFRGELEAI